jgi:hypothetical protein
MSIHHPRDHFTPREPAPGTYALIGDLLRYVEVWARVRLHGVENADDARVIVRAETERLQAYVHAMRDGL